MMGKSWSLDNAQGLGEASLNATSKISKDPLDPLEKGHKAKLIFSFESDDLEVPNTERLWVEILMVQNNNKLLGQLEDDPEYIQDLKRGEIIEFEEHHIIETEGKS